MRYLIIILSIFILSSCADKNARLIGNKANIYGGMGQRVTGDSNSVSIWNIWNAEDAKTIAEGVSQVCSTKFNDFADLYISKMKGSSEWEYSYKVKFKNSLNRAQAEQTLPFVLEWRSLLRRGWSKDKVPTSKEIPDNLFKVSI